MYIIYSVYHPKAKFIKNKLKKFNIQTRSIYPYPIQNMKAYSRIIRNKKFKKFSKKSRGIFCLPYILSLEKKKL